MRLPRRGGQFEDAAIPADAGGRISAAQRIEALAGQRGIVFEGQLDGPVVRQIDGLPVAVVEGRGAGGNKAACLLEIAGAPLPNPKSLAGSFGVAEVEAPAEIEQQAFASDAKKPGS
jgi:hypothetical protein